MVDQYGRWTPEPDYTTFPKHKWCDMDYVMDYINQSGYKVKTKDINWFIEYLTSCFFDDEGFAPKFDDLMINIPMLDEYINACGGLKEFELV